MTAWPVRAPCLGVTRPASPVCASPLYWGLVCGGRCAAYWWSSCGRCWCRWGGLCACSRVWVCLLVEVWVVLLVVVGVNGAGYVRVRACSRVWACLVAVVCVVGIACRLTTFACSRVWVGVLAVVSVVEVVEVTCWLTTFVVVVWACWVFEVVGGGAGRRLGRLVAWVWSPRWCEAAPRWCEATFEAVGRWRDTERCVIVTQHVVGWGGKHPNTREHTLTHEDMIYEHDLNCHRQLFRTLP